MAGNCPQASLVLDNILLPCLFVCCYHCSDLLMLKVLDIGLAVGVVLCQPGGEIGTEWYMNNYCS